MRMAAAEDEALSGSFSGILACSPEMYRMMQDIDRMLDEVFGFTVEVPIHIVEAVRNYERFDENG